MRTLWNISKLLSLLFYTSVVSANHKIFRLEGGQTPYEGRVSVHLKDAGWMPVCSDGWNTDGADVIFNELGFSAGAMWVKSPRVEDKPITSGCVYDVSCPEGSTSWAQCYYNLKNEPCNCKQAKASCNYYGYKGCYNLGTAKGETEKDYNQLTIQDCLGSCRKYSYILSAVLEDKCKCFDSQIEEGKRGSNAICGTACGGDDNHACGGTFPNYGVYESKMGACGGSYQTDNGTIYSPQFPGCYNGKSDCSWSITTVKDHVSLDFTIFNFSDESFEIIITEDYDGSATVLGQYNKTSPPTSIIYSRSEKAFIKLYKINEGNGCDVFAIDFSGRVRCEVPDGVDNGRAVTDSICPYCSGDTVTVVCDPGYVVNSTYSSVECHNGEWNASLPQCIATDKSAYPNTSIIMIEKNDSVQTTQDTGSGLSSGFNLGAVVGLTLFVALIILLIILCCILTRKRHRELRAKNEKADAQTVRLKEIRISEPQCQMTDETEGCIANTD
ncbi:uncharacterized protein [Ptychodera flava]|uniref:uncharacterized protein n=1 Tax=Ptychodera flava TaxID=63121 RepID=UPI003969D787